MITDPARRRLVSIIHAAEILGVSRRTIYNWLALGKIEYVRTAGGQVRIFVDSLLRTPDGGRYDPFDDPAAAQTAVPEIPHG